MIGQRRTALVVFEDHDRHATDLARHRRVVWLRLDGERDRLSARKHADHQLPVVETTVELAEGVAEQP